MFNALIQQVFELQGAAVFIPLGFGLAVGLAYVIISAAWHRKGNSEGYNILLFLRMRISLLYSMLAVMMIEQQYSHLLKECLESMF
jgi:hypothetical protein